MNYKIRELCESEYIVLEDFLYEAIFIPEGASPFPRDIIKKPEFQVYLKDFGKKSGDIGLAAEVDQKIAGVIWARIMNDYGHIDNDTPSLAISLYKEYRNLGIGTAMMKEMLFQLKKQGYKRVSLSVQKANYALRMYENTGFKIFEDKDEEYIMVCTL